MNPGEQAPSQNLTISKWRLISIVLLFIIVCILAFYVFFRKKGQSALDMIPADATLIVRVSDPVTHFLQVKNDSTWQGVLSIPEIGALEAPYMVAKLVLKQNHKLSELSKRADVYLSQHPAGATSQWLTTVPVKAEILQPIVKQAVAVLLKEGWKLNTIFFQGQQITEWKHPKKGKFTMALLPHGWVAATHTILVEDAIRKSKDHGSATLVIPIETKTNHSWLQVYITPNTVNYYGQLVNKILHFSANSPNLFQSARLEFEPSEDRILRFKGDILSSDSEFVAQLGTSVSCKQLLKYVPNSTALYHFSHLDFTKKSASAVLLGRGSTLDVAGFRSELSGKVIFTKGEVFQAEQHNDLFIIEAKNTKKLNEKLLSAIESYSLAHSLALTDNSFKKNAINNLPIPDFAGRILGTTFHGSENSYYSIIDKCLLISNDYSYLKEVIEQIVNNETWLYSKPFKTLEKEHKSHLLTINNKFQEEVLYSVDSLYKPAFNSILNHYSSFEHEIFAYSASVSLHQRQNKLEQEIIFEEAEIIQSLAGIPTLAPKFAYNSSTSKQELVYLDSDNKAKVKNLNTGNTETVRLPFVPSTPPILFNNANDARILGAFKANKLFICPVNDTVLKKLITMPYSTGSISYVFHLQDDRLLIGKSDSLPKVLNTKTGVFSSFTNEHWSGRIPNRPSSFQIGNKLFYSFISLEQELYIVESNGKIVSGFPVKLEARVLETPIYKLGPNLAESSIELLTEYGTMVKYSLAGTLLSRKQFYRPDASTQFHILADVSGHSYLVSSIAKKTLLFYNSDGTLVNKGLSVAGEIPTCQFYQFGGGNLLIVCTYPKTGRSYLYNKELKPLTSKPIDTHFPLSITFSDNTKKFTVYACSSTSLYKLSGNLNN